MTIQTIGVGNNSKRLDPCIQSLHSRNNSLTSGHRACQGCGEALAARCAIDAAYHASRGKIAVVNATGCLEVFSCVFPENSWSVPWIHSIFANAPSVATGVAAAFRLKGEPEVRVIAQGGDGSTTDIGFGALSGMFERNDDVLYICYDNQAYMNTGVQRSSATPSLARTATTLPNLIYRGNEINTGKNIPEIAIAHNIPYVATASVANIKDLEQKIAKAINIRGARYVHIHVPCPLGWGFPPSQTITSARLALKCGLMPLFEAEHGKVIGSTPIDDVINVEEYLRGQRRFAHLFGKEIAKESIAVLQNIANRNIEKYRLIGGCSNV